LEQHLFFLHEQTFSFGKKQFGGPHGAGPHMLICTTSQGGGQHGSHGGQQGRQGGGGGQPASNFSGGHGVKIIFACPHGPAKFGGL
jgi:hypothetical protein